MTAYDYNAIPAGFAPDETHGNHLVVSGGPTSSVMIGDVPKVKKPAVEKKPAIKLPCGFVMPQISSRKRPRSATAAASSAESTPLFGHEEAEEVGKEVGDTEEGVEDLDFQLESVIKALLGFNCAAHCVVHDMTKPLM